jgi:glycosyltransferase involved in cell wall biosynthesis
MCTKKLSVVVLSKNNKDTIVPCVTSTLRAYPKDKEVIVVDASNDGSDLFLSRLREITYVRDSGEGIGLARNLGIAKSSGDIICFVDADTIVEPYHFIKIQKVFEKKPDVGVVSANPKYHFKGMNKVQELEYLLRRQRQAKGDEHLTGYSYFAEGVFLSLRREVWEKCKFWDVKYGADDWDFSMKVIAEGWKIYSIDTESVHIPRATIISVFKEQYGWGVGMKEFFKRHPEYSTYAYRNKKLKISKNPFLLTTLSRFLSPIVSLKYAIPSKKMQLIPYYVFRQFSFLLGVMIG